MYTVIAGNELGRQYERIFDFMGNASRYAEKVSTKYELLVYIITNDEIIARYENGELVYEA